MTDVSHHTLTRGAQKIPGVSMGRGCFRAAAFAALSLLLASCQSLVSPSPGIGAAVPWTALAGWREEHPAQAWPALLESCQKMPAREPLWEQLCADASLFPNPNDDIARAFFETRFVVHEVVGRRGESDGLITGYYEPQLHGSLARTKRFRYPLYKRPDDLVTVDLGGLYPELQGRRLRGRLDGRRVVPYYSRADISRGKRPPDDDVLVWIDDAVALFFLEIQGSGRVKLPDGRVLHVGYADQNGHPYVAIGRTLVQAGALKVEDVTLPVIRAWLAAHPDQAEAVLNSNPSYVFFALRDPNLTGPLGALNVPLTPQRSVAVDPAYVPLGSPMWLDTTLPADDISKPYRRLVFAQDTGGAIKGPARADLFLGHGAEAERLAGGMRSRGRLFVLLPAPRFFN